MADIIIILVVALIIGLAGRYVYKSGKSGHKCVGCPDGCCSGSCDGSACAGCNGKH